MLSVSVVSSHPGCRGTAMPEGASLNAAPTTTVSCPSAGRSLGLDRLELALSSGEGAGNPIKHRLDFRGNRRINSVLYIASVTQQRSQPDAAAYLARKATEGKTRREARRAHKRQLANRIIRRMRRDETTRQQSHPLAA